MTLTEFLLARIAEDGAQARCALPLTGVAALLSKQRQSSVWLAECEAKRRIVELHSGEADDDGDLCATCNDFSNPYWGDTSSPIQNPCETLRLLALPFAEHADYREEWRP